MCLLANAGNTSYYETSEREKERERERERSRHKNKKRRRRRRRIRRRRGRAGGRRKNEERRCIASVAKC